MPVLPNELAPAKRSQFGPAAILRDEANCLKDRSRFTERTGWVRFFKLETNVRAQPSNLRFCITLWLCITEGEAFGTAIQPAHHGEPAIHFHSTPEFGSGEG